MKKTVVFIRENQRGSLLLNVNGNKYTHPYIYLLNIIEPILTNNKPN